MMSIRFLSRSIRRLIKEPMTWEITWEWQLPWGELIKSGRVFFFNYYLKPYKCIKSNLLIFILIIIISTSSSAKDLALCRLLWQRPRPRWLQVWQSPLGDAMCKCFLLFPGYPCYPRQFSRQKEEMDMKAEVVADAEQRQAMKTI